MYTRLVAQTFPKAEAIAFANGEAAFHVSFDGNPEISVLPADEVEKALSSHLRSIPGWDSDDILRFHFESGYITRKFLDGFYDGYDTFAIEKLFPELTPPYTAWEIPGERGITLIVVCDNALFDQSDEILFGFALASSV